MWKRLIIVSVVCLLFFVGCNKKEALELEQRQDEVATEREKRTVPSQKNDEYPYQFPLTGIGSEEEIQGRAVAVMINNHPLARPQSGLNQADIVFELLAEGKVTRFLAIFQSEKPNKVGPVRSARKYYIELAKGYDSLFVAHGYSPEAEQMLKHGFIDHINGMQHDGTLFKRAKNRKAPHNSYIYFDDIVKGANKNNYDMNQAPNSLDFLSDKEIETLVGEQAISIDISYNDSAFNSKLEYDEDLKKYERYSAGKLTVDYDSDEPVLIDNLLVIETSHKVIDDAGRREIDLTSGGKGYLFQKGKMITVEWKNVEGRILPYYNGVKAELVPGRTWVNVIPKSSGLDGAISFQ
ncbi:DUF3048 domain-containing protein [Niallia sp. XMNu-256]|uniref:DUF3048 domain-containing protein n=1 Tax=Niallia sp. XMNu-256 TaxID=3082444 RepID=UPI0030CAAB99